jgi:glycosyltransferase involved in cell wall biosynthesis
MSSARALVVTATEEFGIAAVEAQAAGRPVIAIDEGGARETVIEGETGTLWSPREAVALIEAVRGFDPLAIDPAVCVRNAARFDVERFGTGLRAIIEEALEGDRAPRHPRRTLPRTRRRTRPAA